MGLTLKQPLVIVAVVLLTIASGTLYPNSTKLSCNEPSISCFQDYAFTYLDDVLQDTRSFSVGGLLNFTRNNQSYERENEIDSDDIGVPETLKQRFVKFLLTHDTEVQLFDGAAVRISPRRLESSGLVAKLEISPGSTSGVESRELKSTPRILFKFISK